MPTVVESVNANLAPGSRLDGERVMVSVRMDVGLVIGLIVVVAVVALVTPILVLAYRIGTQAQEIERGAWPRRGTNTAAWPG